MSSRLQSNRRSRTRRGSAILELALTVPVLIALCLGAADFGRVYYDVITLCGAADAGVAFGSLRTANSAQFIEMENVAAEAAADVATVEALSSTAERFCDCPNAPATGPDDDNCVDCIGGSCGSYGNPRVYVSVQVQHEFDTIMTYPGIGESLRVGPAVYRRVQ